MCGIAGLVDFEGRLPEQASLEAMSRAVRHRGPDDEAYFTGAASGLAVGLAHRRLSIIDLSPAGRQPMANADGSLQLVVNGEIYNFAEAGGVDDVDDMIAVDRFRQSVRRAAGRGGRGRRPSRIITEIEIGDWRPAQQRRARKRATSRSLFG